MYAKTLSAMPALIRSLCGAWLCAMTLPAFALLPIQHWQTSSGAQVYFVENHDLPMLDINVDFPAGSAYDTRATSGLAGLTQHTLDLGAGGLSEDDIAQRLADVGADLGSHFDSDRGGVSLRTLSSAEELKQALDILVRVVQSPAFPAAVIEREKARFIDDIKEGDTKPDSLASKNFSALVYGNHPYALRASGEPETLAKLTRDDVVAFYRAHYTADHAVIALIGDLDRHAAEAIAESVTANLPRQGASADLPPVAPLTQAQLLVLPHPASQSHILIGAPGLKRGDPDYFPLYVGNYILGGGGFASRVMDEIREKRGLAYSAYSYFMPLKEAGPFTLGLQTRKDQAGEALAVAQQTLAKFVADGPTADELKKAKQNIIGGFPLRIDSNRKLLDYLSVIGFYQLPLTYMDDFTAKVDKVSVADIRDAFKRRVDPTRMVTVVVGPETLTAPSPAPAPPPAAKAK